MSLSGRPADRAMHRRVERLLAAFLRREARRPATLVPQLLEASFGSEPDADKPALDLDGWLLHGRIDRVDAGDGAALLYDYKLAREVTAGAKFEQEGKLQLPLYLLALRELWGIDPAGGVYVPLRPTQDPRPRGMLRAEDRDGGLLGLSFVDNDCLDGEEFEAVIEGTRERAATHVARMRGGAIDRDPLGGTCPLYCTFAPICRRERGVVAEPDPEKAEEEP
jgi:hypothetical protein